MASQTLTTIAHIKGVDTATGMLNRLAARTAALQTRMQKLGAAARRLGNNLGGPQMGLMGASMAAAGFLRSQYNLEDSLNRSRAILNLTTKEFRPLMKEVERLGGIYPLTMADAAEASVEFGTAGLNASQQIAIFEQAVKGAMASGVSVAKVAGGVTDVIYGLGLAFKTSKEQADSFRTVNDVLAAAAVSYNQTYEGFLAGFRKAAPVLKVTGVDMRMGAAMLGAMANAGIKAERAGTAMRTMFVRLLAPTGKAIGLLEDAGIKIEDFQTKTGRSPTATGVEKFVKTQLGLELPKTSELNKILQDPRLQGSATEMANALSQHIIEATGQRGSENTGKVAKAMQDFVRLSYSKMDYAALFKTLIQKKVPISVWKELLGLRHIEKGLALGDQLATGKFQSDMTKFLDKLVYKNGKGPVDRFMDIMLSGFPGAVKKLNSALDVFARAMGTSGALDDVGNVADRLRKSVLELSGTSPDLMRWGTIALIAVGALAPLGFVVMGVTAAISPLLVVISRGLPILVNAASMFMRFSGAVTSFGATAAGLTGAATALRVFGKALGGLGIGVAIAHWRELLSFFQGFGAQLFGGGLEDTDDMIGVDGKLTAGERIANSFAKIGNAIKPITALIKGAWNWLMKLIGIPTEDNALTQFFKLGEMAAQRLADVIETIADGIKKLGDFGTWAVLPQDKKAELAARAQSQLQAARNARAAQDGTMAGLLSGSGQKPFGPRGRVNRPPAERTPRQTPRPMSSNELGSTPGGRPVIEQSRAARVDTSLKIDVSGNVRGVDNLKVSATSPDARVKATTPRTGKQTN